MKKCLFCKANKSVIRHTDMKSPSQACWLLIMSMNKSPLWNIEIHGDDTTYYIPHIKFCPICGRDLTQPVVRIAEQNDYTTLPVQIKDKMDELGISLCQLAKDTGIAKGTLSEYLNGKYDDLGFKKMMKIINYLEINI